MSTPHPQHEEIFRVRVYHTGGGGPRANLPAVLDLLQEAAGNHAAQFRVSPADMLERGTAWVTSRICVRMDRFPDLGETVVVRTWPHARDQFSTRRDFLLLGGDGGEIGRAASVWVVMDIAARKLAPLPDYMDGMWDATPRPALDLPSKAVPRLAKPESETPILVRRADLDINGHVNNARFPEWCLESLEQWPGRLVQADIAFRAECRLGDAVVSRTGPGGDGLLHSLSREGAELCRMKTWWAGASPLP
ncbi:acyl-ACP thioesterase domain-containing protein [Desulfovibrio aminophilus]|uniref:acyl-[acyl-carrier-protein] thioesterase n=1 Tax=Desulfovibrio aminophilus TaxID=81425 RepID=UPI00339B622B